MNPEEIQKSREICEAATDGPWIGDTYSGWVKYFLWGKDKKVILEVNHKDNSSGFLGENRDNDEMFIKHARTALPKALNAIERQEQMIQALLKEIDLHNFGENDTICPESMTPDNCKCTDNCKKCWTEELARLAGGKDE